MTDHLPVQMKHIMVLTGELSGDLHGSALIRSLQVQSPHLYFSGIGGSHMKDAGADLFYDIRNLSAMGLTEVISQFSSIKAAFGQFKKKMHHAAPDLIVLIDYPGFNLKAAAYAKKHFHSRILYFITPKVWAWKRSRLKTIRQYVDFAALILPFEEKIFKSAGIRSAYVGNPLVDLYPEHSIRFESLKSHRKMYIGLLPGSRNAEIRQLLPVMLKAADRISEKYPDTCFLVSKTGNIDDALFEGMIASHEQDSGGAVLQIKVHKGPVQQIFEKATCLIAASGTVTLEAALCCVPTILTYKVSAFTYRVGKLFVKLDFVGLANLIVNEAVMPELLQDDATPEKMAEIASDMILRPEFYRRRLSMVRTFLGRKGASMRTASIALAMIRESNRSCEI